MMIRIKEASTNNNAGQKALPLKYSIKCLFIDFKDNITHHQLLITRFEMPCATGKAR